MCVCSISMDTHGLSWSLLNGQSVSYTDRENGRGLGHESLVWKKKQIQGQSIRVFSLQFFLFLCVQCPVLQAPLCIARH